ncbi:ATP-binding protein [Rhodoferax saidenbachensis]|uniref:histidine kinase n=1 Tax=Rhodoferax saidenbachensis TaxID=1484693 RepID=A0ABU1ZMC5_9BURK|nr:ATP-binding protein [Rhodoferax saidenbachensis]MDR7306695.1 signal transduction histidine kinase/ActR/RegA family two-component response regulator [Rhodoferax saidenbachensis]
MMFPGIRARMLAAALLPVFLVVVALVAIFWTSRVADLDESHDLRAKLMARQAALASEYGLFSGNVSALQVVLGGMQREADVRSVAVFDVDGRMLASTGVLQYKGLQEATGAVYQAFQRSRDIDVLAEPVASSSVPLDDFFGSSVAPPTPPAPLVLGHVVVEISRGRLLARERELLLLALAVGFAGLVLGGFLATRMGEGVVRPVLRVSRMIERIGEGDLTPSSEALPTDPLYVLQTRLNQMAQRLAWGREEMEFRVESATRELRLKKEEAETATLAKSRFLAAASHDLRQPTHALGMFVARLGQLPLDIPTRQLVASLEASVQSMQDLLDGLLDISRLDAGAVQVQRGAVNIGELFASLRKALVPLAEGKGLRLRVRPSRHWALTDPMLLQRMVMNLTNNALRYTERGTVLISCRSVDGGRTLRLDVSDSGIGISPAHQADIFKEFYQVGNSGRDRAQGLGLGLNIVERTAQLLGHPIALRSDLGCGTRFSIFLPVAQAMDSLAGAVATESTSLLGLEGMRVLVIEDDGFALEAISDLLTSWGCVVHAAASVAQALDFANGYAPPDVVLSDFRLGEERNGLDVIAMVRATAGREIPACLMSGDTDAALIQAAKDAGLTLLHKPVRPAKLRSLLRRLVMAAGSVADEA